MATDIINFAAVPSDPEAAFIYLERQAREIYETESDHENRQYVDQNGNYYGQRNAERKYISNVTAFVDELRLSIDESFGDLLHSLSDFRDTDEYFMQMFRLLLQKTHYTTSRFELRQYRRSIPGPGEILMIDQDYKDKIGNLLRKIEKIVNHQVADEEKRDRIYKKIAALQLEVNRDRTTIDNIFNSAIKLSKTIGECAENSQPLMKILEQLKSLLWSSGEKNALLSEEPKPPLITTQSQPENGQDLDDDIPF